MGYKVSQRTRLFIFIYLDIHLMISTLTVNQSMTDSKKRNKQLFLTRYLLRPSVYTCDPVTVSCWELRSEQRSSVWIYSVPGRQWVTLSLTCWRRICISRWSSSRERRRTHPHLTTSPPPPSNLWAPSPVIPAPAWGTTDEDLAWVRSLNVQNISGFVQN